MSDSKAVSRSQRRKKQKAVDYFGGKCQLCGYDKCLSALEFHHEDEDLKEHSPSYIILRWSWDRCKEELEKCILVCANCHREIHFGMYEPEILRNKVLPTLKKTCVVCEVEFETKRDAATYCSQKCCKISQRKVNRPAKKELQLLIQENGYRGTGRIFDVADNTVRKWAKSYNII